MYIAELKIGDTLTDEDKSANKKAKESALIPEDNKYIVVKRYYVAKDPASFDEMRKDILMDVKGEDFSKLLKMWFGEMGATAKANEASVKRYKPSSIKFS